MGCGELGELGVNNLLGRLQARVGQRKVGKLCPESGNLGSGGGKVCKEGGAVKLGGVEVLHYVGGLDNLFLDELLKGD